MKKCIICELPQELTEFYVHKQMGDGHLNKCKTCCKSQAKEREEKLRQDPDWVEKEQTRARDKYYRLGYKNKHKPTKEDQELYRIKYNKEYPEKYKAKIASQRTNKKKGIENHHWSYNEIHWKDCIPLDKRTHMFLHRFIQYDQSTFMYKDKNGNLLDTKEKHENYLQLLLNSYEEVNHDKK